MAPERALVRIIRNVAAERGIEFQSLSQDWMLRLSRGGVTRWVFGYDLDLNSCCAQQIAKDKAAASLALGRAGVPRVEHVLVSHPLRKAYVPESGTWPSIDAFARRHNYDVVCKSNEGSGGHAVMRATNPVELEEAVFNLFARVRTLALCPYVEMANEFRVIVLRGRCLLTYRKVRPTLTGDGRSTRLELTARRLKTTDDAAAMAKAIGELSRRDTDLNAVVPAGETWAMNWKYNLGLGAAVELLGETFDRRADLERLAIDAAAALNLQFGSVDVAEVLPGRSLMVLEVNAGVMMESFVSRVPDGWRIATDVYRAAVDAMFPH